MKTLIFIATCALLALLPAHALPAQEDIPGSRDHPLFQRIPGYWIADYSEEESGDFGFEDRDGIPVMETGRFTRIGYLVGAGARVANKTQLLRLHQHAFVQAGGAVVFDGRSDDGSLTTTMTRVGNGRVTWVRVWVGGAGRDYTIVIVERSAPGGDGGAVPDAAP